MLKGNGDGRNGSFLFSVSPSAFVELTPQASKCEPVVMEAQTETGRMSRWKCSFPVPQQKSRQTSEAVSKFPVLIKQGDCFLKKKNFQKKEGTDLTYRNYSSRSVGVISKTRFQYSPKVFLSANNSEPNDYPSQICSLCFFSSLKAKQYENQPYKKYSSSAILNVVETY